MNLFALIVARSIDAEIAAVRVRHAARLAAEHARIVQERQAVIDAAIVQAREVRVNEVRARAFVRTLVEPKEIA